MKKLVRIIVIISGILTILILGALSVLILTNIQLPGDNSSYVPHCTPLPTTFSDEDLVGTWVAEYFGGDAVDKLVIKDNGIYKQIYSSTDGINFESDWKEWRIEYKPEGYALLHLDGMRRCDGILETCNNPGGGLPEGSTAVNVCEGGAMYYSDEVILFVTGSSLDVPNGIVLIHARAAGSEWNYSFQLEK